MNLPSLQMPSLQMPSIKMPSVDSTSDIWKWGTLVFILVLMLIYLGIAIGYRNMYGTFREDSKSISNLLTIRRQELGSKIDSLVPNTTSVCSMMLQKTAAWKDISQNASALVNWRPLTVRLSGYLGGINGARDGVFDMTKGIRMALHLGARAFFFELDYLDSRPCSPLILFRDDQGIKRSLMGGSLDEGIKTLSTYSFSDNYDPVLVILYFNRIPPGTNQKKNFFINVAKALDSLSSNHLGITEAGNFHGCNKENILFTSPLCNYQKKFIILTNYNTFNLGSTSNPKDNLHFWTNARIYTDQDGNGSFIGPTTTGVASGGTAYIQVGATNQLSNMPNEGILKYNNKTINIFKISMAPPDYKYTYKELDFLMNSLGINCIPLNIFNDAITMEHLKTLQNKNKKPNPTLLKELSMATNDKDLLSFWTYGGWSYKN
jgi:hypothetical protein